MRTDVARADDESLALDHDRLGHEEPTVPALALLATEGIHNVEPYFCGLHGLDPDSVLGLDCINRFLLFRVTSETARTETFLYGLPVNTGTFRSITGKVYIVESSAPQRRGKFVNRKKGSRAAEKL